MSVVPPEAEPASQHEREVFEAVHRNWPSRNRQKKAWVTIHRNRMALLFDHPLITPEIEDVLRRYL